MFMSGIMGFGKIIVIAVILIAFLFGIIVMTDIEKKKDHNCDKWILFTDTIDIYYDISQIPKLKKNGKEFYYDKQKGSVSDKGDIIIFPNATLIKSHHKVFLNRLYKDGEKLQF